ncbi:PAS domain S-box protein [Capilliphycus salinus ALCB114379]|uniref:PAS domain-containing sensor histidine kinase n=1 Tax=Capilliphycus salinus TaxID=2768948 RepID=UPI0039A6DF5D
MLTENLLATTAFMPHGTCYLWKPGLVGLHLASNAIIALSYLSIPVGLVYIVEKREDIPFNWIFLLFAGFIISCGCGHLLDIWTLWHPNYWISGIVRAITAIVSLTSAIALVVLMPKIFKFPSPKQMEQSMRLLRQEIEERKQVEQELKKSEERWQLTLEGTGDGIFDWDVASGELFMSTQLKADLGYRDWEMENRFEAWYSRVHPDDLDRVLTTVQDHLDGKTVKYAAEYRLRCADGSYKWILARGIAHRNKHGQAIRMVGSQQDISDRKRAEAALTESEARYRLLAENAKDMISTHTREGVFLYVSPACRHLLGYEPDELIGRSLYEFFHPTDAAAWQRTYTVVGQLPDEYTTTYRVRRRDGSYVWFETTSRAISSDQSAEPMILCISRDITLRKQAEEEIARFNDELEQRVQERTAQLEVLNELKDELLEREREARAQAEAAQAKIKIYEDIVENIPIGMTVWHLEDLDDLNSFRLISSNPEASHLLGMDLNSQVGGKMVECFPKLVDTHCHILQAYAQVVRHQQPCGFSEMLYSDDRRVGESLFAVKAFPLPNQRLGIAFEDITERKRIEKALSESERLYRSVLNSVQEVIFQTDIEGNLSFLSPAWTLITGFTVSESLDTPLLNYIYAEEDQRYCAEQLRRLIETEQDDFIFEFRSLKKNGDFCWLEIDAQLNCNGDNEMIGVWGTINDVTKRKQTEAVLQARADELTQLNAILLTTTGQLEKRNKELDQFAYVASHDLKAPLRAIANLSEWIEEDIQDKLDDDTRHQMSLLRGRVHRMENLINGLLQYSRVGRIQAKAEKVEVGKLLEDVIDSLDPPSTFTIEIEGEMPTLITQRLSLEQVFSNLISNAIKHHERPDGRVTVKSVARGKFYEFSVTDDGPGIAPQYREKVFTIFQTLKPRDEAENTGIGLSIVKKIIETQGGTIELESDLGQGATFRFSWPK